MAARVEWDDLEVAFEQSEAQWSNYIDRETGEVLGWCELLGDDEGIADRVEEGGPARYARVEPPSTREQWRWMEAYAGTVTDRACRQRLLSAIEGRGAFRRFRQELDARPILLDGWYRFRNEQTRRAMRAWLDENGFVSDEPPAPRDARVPVGLRYSTDHDDIDLALLARLFDAVGWQRRTADGDRFEQMVRGSARIAVAWFDDELVGFARAVSDEAFNAYIGTVVVDPRYRRRGIGRALVELLLENGDGLQFVLHGADDAREFYAKLGFESAQSMLWRRRAR